MPFSILIKEMHKLKTEKIWPDLELRKQDRVHTLGKQAKHIWREVSMLGGGHR